MKKELLEFPNLNKIDTDKPLFINNENEVELFKLLSKTIKPEYLFWDKAKHIKNNHCTPEELWVFIKYARKISTHKTPIKTPDNKYFSWSGIYKAEELLHEIDLNTGGALIGSFAQHSQDEKHKFISRGIIEEAIASSQLEGANTTRKYAKRFIREGKKPQTQSEHMIVNNFTAMNNIQEGYKHRKLSIELLYELHEQITKNTIPEEDLGRLRNDSDQIIIISDKNTIAFEPPKEKFFKNELTQFIKFCNNELEHPFIHPVIKAIVIHFWFAYLHPFVDGNGRMARLLFYWFLIKNGYWAFAYLPISTIIKKSHKSYEKSFIYSEQDDNDLTYFIDYNLSKIKLAMKDFQEYAEKKAKDSKSINKLNKFKFNTRQASLLQYFLGDPDSRTTVKTYMNLHNISRRTSETDLKKLTAKKLLKTIKVGRNVYYHPINNLNKKLS